MRRGSVILIENALQIFGAVHFVENLSIEVRKHYGAWFVAERQHPDRGDFHAARKDYHPIAGPSSRQFNLRRSIAEPVFQDHSQCELAVRVLGAGFPIAKDFLVTRKLDPRGMSEVIEVERRIDYLLSRFWRTAKRRIDRIPSAAPIGLADERRALRVLKNKGNAERV